MKNNRFRESIATHFEKNQDKKNRLALILTSSSDIGVRRNNGRNGARFAPEAILNTLKKLNSHFHKNDFFEIQEVASQAQEKEDFESAQKISSQKIYNEIKNSPSENIIHIGGGHDHAYPLLMAMDRNENISNIVIINIDAHCDTRIDNQNHSGTPFRNYSENASKNFHLIQVGIQDFANSKSTLTPLKDNNQDILWIDECTDSEIIMNKILHILENKGLKLGKETGLFISLDIDAIEGSKMRAVSAVNPDGLSFNCVKSLTQKLKKLDAKYKILGLYEFNPIFDDLSQLGTRSITNLIYNYLKI